MASEYLIIRIDSDKKRALKEFAFDNKMTMTNVLREIISEFLADNCYII